MMDTLSIWNKGYKVHDYFYRKGLSRQIGLLIGLLLIICALSTVSPYFMTWRNILNIIRSISIAGVFAIGMTVVILTGEIDLSTGSIAALSALLLVDISQSYGIVFGIVASVLTGIIVGIINGLLVIRGKMPSFAATMATMLIANGTALLYCGGSPIVGVPDRFRVIGIGYLWGIPVPVYIFFALLLLVWYVLTNISFGRHIYAVGGNADAARLNGINVERIKLIAFTLMGGLASFGAMLMVARTNTATAYMGEGLETEAIAAAVAGGTLLSGGVGNVWGTLLGVSILTVIDNGLNLIGVASNYKYMARGLIIIGALLSQRALSNRKLGTTRT